MLLGVALQVRLLYRAPRPGLAVVNRDREKALTQAGLLTMSVTMAIVTVRMYSTDDDAPAACPSR